MKTKSKKQQSIDEYFDNLAEALQEETISWWRDRISDGTIDDYCVPDWEYVRGKYDAILTLDPKNTKALTGLADFLNDIDQDYGDALLYYQQAANLAPNGFQEQYNLAVCLDNADRSETEVKKQLLKAIKARPNWFENSDNLDIETDFIYQFTSAEEREAVYEKAEQKPSAAPWLLLTALAGAGLAQFAAAPHKVSERGHREGTSRV